MGVGVCVRMYACMHACMFTYIHIHTDICIQYIHTDICIQVQGHTTHTYGQAETSPRVRRSERADYIHGYMCIYTHIYRYR